MYSGLWYHAPMFLLLVSLPLFVLGCQVDDGEPDVKAPDTAPGLVDGDGDGFTTEDGDCDDANNAVAPGQAEQCDNIDNNCDGDVDEGLTTPWYPDTDEDGFGDLSGAVTACEPPDAGYIADGTDCDDTRDDVYPLATDLCDELDNDCDGAIDEELGELWYADEDGDGFGAEATGAPACDAPEGRVADSSDCDDTRDVVHPGHAELCDELDNNCDGVVDEGVTTPFYEDVDDDGYGADALTTEACAEPAGYAAIDGDCDDMDAAFNPGAMESCSEAIDYNCDGSVAYADADADGWAACEECDDGAADVNPSAPEVCNTIDDDCDGAIDDDDTDVDTSTGSAWYADADSDRYGNSATEVWSCATPVGYTADFTDCDDTSVAVNPAATEVCNTIDDDCDGAIDDADGDLDTSTGSVWYADADTDGFGALADTVASCDAPAGYGTDATDCNDADPTVNPAAAEVCNGVDDDCDGATDDDDTDVDTSTGSAWYADSDSDGYGALSDTVTTCDAPAGYGADATDCDDADATVNPGAAEACNGVDDDCDGDTDEGVIGATAACPAEDCAEILALDSTAASGTYYLDPGLYYCDMVTDGGGWTRVKEDLTVWGTSYDTTYYNTEGFTWAETLFAYASGSLHAHCIYPGSLTGCNNLGFQFASEAWGVPLNWGSSICGMSTTDYTAATTYIGGYDFVVARSASTDTIRLGALEAISSCTIADNPGAAYVDVLVRP